MHISVLDLTQPELLLRVNRRFYQIGSQAKNGQLNDLSELKIPFDFNCIVKHFESSVIWFNIKSSFIKSKSVFLEQCFQKLLLPARQNLNFVFLKIHLTPKEQKDIDSCANEITYRWIIPQLLNLFFKTQRVLEIFDFDLYRLNSSYSKMHDGITYQVVTIER